MVSKLIIIYEDNLSQEITNENLQKYGKISNRFSSETNSVIFSCATETKLLLKNIFSNLYGKQIKSVEFIVDETVINKLTNDKYYFLIDWNADYWEQEYQETLVINCINKE